MKRSYIKPTTLVVEIKSQPLMVVSGGKGNVSGVTVTEENFTGGQGDILSRRGRSIWDDDDDDYGY